MMPAEQHIITFCYLLENQPLLFSDHQDSLIELRKNLPNDVNEISNTIIRWLKEHNFYNYLLEASDGEQHERGIRGTPNMHVEECLELIDNSIRKTTAAKTPSSTPNNANESNSGRES